MADAPGDFIAAMPDMIVAFRITPQRVLAKSKLSQNREPRDVDGVIADMDSRGETATAAAMRRPIPNP